MRPHADRAILGRESEIALLEDLLDRDGARSIVLTGAAGAGKSTLWEHACDSARSRGEHVLVTRARDAEAALELAGLGDLLDRVDREVIDGLPAPQSAALDVALLQSEPEGRPPGERAVAVALLGVLRRLAASAPVLVAVDDVQWLDASTADALAFAARRLERLPVRVLLAERTDVGTAFAPPPEAEVVEIGPLGRNALQRLLRERLGLRLQLPVLVELERVSQGNALFALEVGRRLLRDGVPPAGEGLPQPAAVEDLVSDRLAGLPADVRRLMLAVALTAEPRRAELARVVGDEVIHAALAGGVLAVEGPRLLPAHPLLATAAVRAASPAEQRMVHAELAGVASDDQRRARHRALAADRPDGELATSVAAAAGAAASRGAVADAAALADHALRLTPPRAAVRPERVLALAERLCVAGRFEQVTDLLGSELDGLPPGSARARARLLLSDAADVDSIQSLEALLQDVLDEDGAGPDTRASALARLIITFVLGRVAGLDEAESLGRRAHEAARGAASDVRLDVLHATSWTQALRGLPVDDDDDALVRSPRTVDWRTDRVTAVRRIWRGEIGAARAELTELQRIAEECGQAWGHTAASLHLAELELRAGDCTGAARLLDQLAPVDCTDFRDPGLRRCQALLAALRGDTAEVGRHVQDVVANAARTGVRWDLLEAWRAQGLAALAAGEPAQAAEHLGRVWAHLLAEEIDELGAFPVASDLVEALVALGRLDEASNVAARLADLGERHEHPWALACAHRARALVQLARSADDGRALTTLATVARAFTQHGLRHDAARTLLALGRIQRRRRRWGDARRALEDAATGFAAAGADGWAAIARAELERVGARRPRADPAELTPAESRVVELAIAGLSNKAIAHALVVTVSTVEAQLTSSYAKLGVRSRVQLAGRLASAEKV